MDRRDKVFEAALAFKREDWGLSVKDAVAVANLLVTEVYNGPEMKCSTKDCTNMIRPEPFGPFCADCRVKHNVEAMKDNIEAICDNPKHRS
jgi:hypothetical protein